MTRTRGNTVRSSLSLAGAVVMTAVCAVAGAGHADADVVADPQWQPTQTLARAATLGRPDVVADDAGRETVVWTRQGKVWAQRRTANGTWRAPVAVGFGSGPQLGVDDAGRVTAVWSFRIANHGPQVLVASSVPGRRAWSQPEPLTPAVNNNVSSSRGAFTPTLAVGSSGDTVVSWLWNQQDSGASRVQAAYRPDGRDWGPTRNLSALEAHHPSAAIDEAGRAAVAWALNGDMLVARRTGGTWGTPELVGEHGEPPHLAAADDGTLALVFSGLTASGFRPQAATKDVGEPWTDPVLLDDPAPDVSTGEPMVGLSATGLATAAWGRGDDTVQAASRTAGGDWTDPVEIAPAGARVLLGRGAIDVAVGDSGHALVTFTRAGQDGTSVGAAFRLAAAWAPARRVSPFGCSDAKGAMTDTAALSLVWRCTQGRDRVQYRHAAGN